MSKSVPTPFDDEYYTTFSAAASSVPKKKLLRKAPIEAAAEPEAPRKHLVRRVIEEPVAPIAKPIIRPALSPSKIGERPVSVLVPRYEAKAAAADSFYHISDADRETYDKYRESEEYDKKANLPKYIVFRNSVIDKATSIPTKRISYILPAKMKGLQVKNPETNKFQTEFRSGYFIRDARPHQTLMEVPDKEIVFDFIRMYWHSASERAPSHSFETKLWTFAPRKGDENPIQMKANETLKQFTDRKVAEAMAADYYEEAEDKGERAFHINSAKQSAKNIFETRERHLTDAEVEYANKVLARMPPEIKTESGEAVSKSATVEPIAAGGGGKGRKKVVSSREAEIKAAKLEAILAKREKEKAEIAARVAKNIKNI
jgi:hypothetical protein